MSEIANVEMANAWDGDEGEYWTANADRYDGVIARYSPHLLAGAAIGVADVVLDIGCGCGATTRDAARAAAQGTVLGVDLSSQMLDRAREISAREGLANVQYTQADAQVHRFPTATFDVAISRFGCMFFADPVGAFTNIGRAMRPPGRMALLAWQGLQRNEGQLAIRQAFAMGRELPPAEPGSPGPFGLADPDQVRKVLSEAGWTDTAFASIEEPIVFGQDPDDAFAFVSTNGVARGMLADLDDTDRATALDNLRALLETHQTPDGVAFDSAAWLVTARTSGTP